MFDAAMLSVDGSLVVVLLFTSILFLFLFSLSPSVFLSFSFPSSFSHSHTLTIFASHPHPFICFAYYSCTAYTIPNSPRNGPTQSSRSPRPRHRKRRRLPVDAQGCLSSLIRELVFTPPPNSSPNPTMSPALTQPTNQPNTLIYIYI